MSTKPVPLCQPCAAHDRALITCGLNFLSAALLLVLIGRDQEPGASEAQIGLLFSHGGSPAALLVFGVVSAALAAAVRFDPAVWNARRLHAPPAPGRSP